MAVDTYNLRQDPVGSWLIEQLNQQSWSKKNANTVTAVVGLLVTVVAWLATTPLISAEWVQALVVIAGFAGTVFGIKKTPNGFSESQIKKITDVEADVIGNTPLVVDNHLDSVDPDEEAEELTRLVLEYREGVELDE